MNERAVRPTEDIRMRQRQAGDPAASAWVAANAGSGKTHVLTQRVLRLLLSGVAPENLLCLTYTKAAAAEMRRRVATHLGEWATLPENELVTVLTELAAAGGSARPDAVMIRRARTLFGHALETPGGLKINTIHAFCESVLQRFPLEAGVPFGFAVIEDAEQAEMIRAARDRVLSGALHAQNPASAAVAHLFATMSDDQMEKAVSAALGAGEDLAAVLADPDRAKANLRQLTGHRAGVTVESLTDEIVSGALLPPAHYPDVFAVTPPKGGNRSFEDRLALIDIRNPDSQLILSAFLTSKEKVPGGNYFKKALMESPSGIGDRAVAEAGRLEALCARMRAARLVQRSEALLDVMGAIAADYAAQKRARALLDFDDLIARMADLLESRESREWVRYKLDAGITHILVDESQDTNPAQWRIVRKLTEEFFAGDGIAQAPRTVFSVGDNKQSIYSFQGAAPHLFTETGRELRMHALRIDAAWYDVELKASFRTLPGILDAVDRVCARPDIGAALLAGDTQVAHESAREDKGGTVTLWPPERQEDVVLPADRWPMDTDFRELQDAARKVAERIARTIGDWVNTGRPLAQRGRAIRPDDVLVLVQSRGQLFQEIIRALKRKQIPSPGSDRLPVSSHIAVLDLMALGDILINPDDDLNLAAVLRSPLFDVSEDDLFTLAANRQKGERLWSRLQRTELPTAREAYERLYRWRQRLDFDRPYEFFSEVLYAGQGLKRFHARLGEEVDDVLAEFLDLALAHEHDAQPSLQGFLAAMRRRDVSIKRELSEGGGGVRVMTVHGAKGLEAPIVILADAATGPNCKAKPVYALADAPGPLLVHASSKDRDHTEQTVRFAEADEANQKQEYWRKLYVAMTRAEDELYVTGVLTRKGKLEGTWYEAIADALANDMQEIKSPEGDIEKLVFPAAAPTPKPVSGGEAAAEPARRAFVPEALPLRLKPEIIHPSDAGEGSPEPLETRAQSVLTAAEARKQGTALHALLQHLGGIAPDMRSAVALRALERLIPELAAHHQAIADKALSILGNPDHAHLFGPDSRAEVPFLAEATQHGAPKLITGRIDRLVVTENSVLVVDFKSDAQPAEALARNYLVQLGLYRLVGKKLFAKRQIEAAIFWTTTEKLMRVSAERLDGVIEGFTIR